MEVSVLYIITHHSVCFQCCRFI